MKAVSLASLIPLAAVLAIICPRTAAAQETEEVSSLAVDAALTVVSDYRFRGLSLSDGKPALQPELWLTHSSGIYVGFWGSNLAEYGGATVETDLTVGFAKSVGPVGFDVYATWYRYPGGKDVDYVEITSIISADLGPATLGVELAYVPAQSNIGDIDNLYGALHFSASLGSLPLSIEGSIGVEDGAFADTKTDWALGLKGDFAGLELRADYVDAANHGQDPWADPTVILSAKKSF